jgi:hypothetical protein
MKSLDRHGRYHLPDLVDATGERAGCGRQRRGAHRNPPVLNRHGPVAQNLLETRGATA